jgi:hypothetical protein
MAVIPEWLTESLRLAEADNVRIRMESAALIDEFLRLRETLDATRADVNTSHRRN